MGHFWKLVPTETWLKVAINTEEPNSMSNPRNRDFFFPSTHKKPKSFWATWSIPGTHTLIHYLMTIRLGVIEEYPYYLTSLERTSGRPMCVQIIRSKMASGCWWIVGLALPWCHGICGAGPSWAVLIMGPSNCPPRHIYCPHNPPEVDLFLYACLIATAAL